MTQALIATCVGGRRASAVTQTQVKQRATKHGDMQAKPFWGFTPREREVLDALIETGHMKLTAASLGISKRTVEVHLHHMRAKAATRGTYRLVALYVMAKCKDDL